MEPKYYRPTIEEFHVGFEYEQLLNNVWKKYTLETYHDLEIIYDEINEGVLRVKCLTKGDIESFGWKRDESVKSEYYTILNNVLIVSNLFIHIFQLKDYESEFPCFKGTIKNKFELRKIMKMNGIKK